MTPMSKRQPLPTNIKKRILERDDHKCCKCGQGVKIGGRDFALIEVTEPVRE